MQLKKLGINSFATIPMLVGMTFACSAFAQSSVTLFGTLDVGLIHLRTTTATGVTSRVTSLAGGGIQTPLFGFSGVEDLGNGLSATFALATYLNRMDSGAVGRNATDPFFSAGAEVGLASRDWGALRFGRILTPTLVTLFETNAWLGSTSYGDSFLSNWGGVVLGDSGFSNAVRYDSPTLNGFRAQVMYSLGEERSAGPDKHFGVGYDWRLDYKSGSFRTTLAGRSINQSTRGNGLKQNMTILGTAYDFGSATIFSQYVTVDDRYTQRASNVNRAGLNVGVRVPVGSVVLIASTTRVKIDDINPVTASRRSTTTVGADYFLSKRTDLYVAYSSDRFSSPAGSRTIRVGGGIRHKF